MKGMGKMEDQRRLYGRYIVGASFLILFFYSGAQYAFGVMFKPVVREFGWSRSAVSLVFLVNMVVFAIALTIVGRLYDRFGPKWIIIISTLFLSAGFVLTSFIHSLGQFFFSYGIMAALGLAGTGVPLVSTLVSKWFDRGRGLAISLSLAGSSVGAFVLVRLLSLFAVSYGWRTSYFYLGIVMLLVNSLLAIFVIKGDPRHLGMAEDTGYSDEDAGGVKSPAGMDLRQAMATRSFWLFLATMFVCGSGDYLATSHFINFATDIGVSPIAAGNMMSWYGLLSFAGILVAGPAADRIGSKMPVVLTFVLRFLLYLFIVRYKNVPSLYIFALLFGFTHLITAPLTPMLMGRLYGFRQIGLLTGVVNTVHFLGGGIFTYATGLIFDRTGSYQMAFIVAAAMAAAAALCSSLIAERSHAAASLPGEARSLVPTACC
jgi:MFS family permease